MRKLLLPFSLIFRVIVYIRNILYNYNFFKTIQLNSPVISVGNLSVGGTGKTPLVEFIAKFFLNKGKFIAIVTKGYKRIFDDIQIVELNYKDNEHKLSAEHFGDESLNLLQNLSDIGKGRGLIVVSENKRSGAKLVDSKFKPDVIIIDDAFQHRKLKRDIDIVVINHDFKGNMLPAGNMREPVKSLKRADAVVMNHKFEETLFKKGRLLNLIECIYIFESFKNFENKEPVKPVNNCIAFCGIGDPDSFSRLLEVNKIEIKSFIKFPDHYNYKAEDISAIIKAFKDSNAEYILTTQKDYVKLKYRDNKSHDFKIVSEFIENYPVYFAKIGIEFIKNEDLLTDKISDILKD